MIKRIAFVFMVILILSGCPGSTITQGISRHTKCHLKEHGYDPLNLVYYVEAEVKVYNLYYPNEYAILKKGMYHPVLAANNCSFVDYYHPNEIETGGRNKIDSFLLKKTKFYGGFNIDVAKPNDISRITLSSNVSGRAGFEIKNPEDVKYKIIGYLPVK